VGDKSDRLKGHAKEKAGQASGDPRLAREGRTDQAKGDLKKSAEKAKDAVKKL
jgi:uncharacterized protein YjbJ (UPF0337 family)